MFYQKTAICRAYGNSSSHSYHNFVGNIVSRITVLFLSAPILKIWAFMIMSHTFKMSAKKRNEEMKRKLDLQNFHGLKTCDQPAPKPIVYTSAYNLQSAIKVARAGLKSVSESGSCSIYKSDKRVAQGTLCDKLYNLNKKNDFTYWTTNVIHSKNRQVAWPPLTCTHKCKSRYELLQIIDGLQKII